MTRTELLNRLEKQIREETGKTDWPSELEQLLKDCHGYILDTNPYCTCPKSIGEAIAGGGYDPFVP